MSRVVVVESGFGWAIAVAVGLAVFFWAIAVSDQAKYEGRESIIKACIQQGKNAVIDDYGDLKECK